MFKHGDKVRITDPTSHYFNQEVIITGIGYTNNHWCVRSDNWINDRVFHHTQLELIPPKIILEGKLTDTNNFHTDGGAEWMIGDKALDKHLTEGKSYRITIEEL